MRLSFYKILTKFFAILTATSTLSGSPLANQKRKHEEASPQEHNVRDQNTQERADKNLWGALEELVKANNTKNTSLDAIREAIKQGANVNAVHPSTGESILDYAQFNCNNGNLINLFLSLGARVSADNLYRSIRARQESNVHALLKARALAHLSEADIQNGLRVIFEQDLSALNLHEQKNYFLRKIIQLLFVYGAQPKTLEDQNLFSRVFADQEEFLYMSTREEQLPSVRRALLRGASLKSQSNTDFGTPLHIALSTKNKLLVQELLKLPEIRAIINVANGDGRTPLAVAAASNSSDLVKLLLRYGAMNSRGIKLDTSDSEECTPLSYALGFGALKTVKSLIKAGSTPDYLINALRRTREDLSDDIRSDVTRFTKLEPVKMAALHLFLRHSVPVYSFEKLQAAVSGIKFRDTEQDELIATMLKNGVVIQTLDDKLANNYLLRNYLLRDAILGKPERILAFLIVRAVLLGWNQSACKLFLHSAFSLSEDARVLFRAELIKYLNHAQKHNMRSLSSFLLLLTQHVLHAGHTEAESKAYFEGIAANLSTQKYTYKKARKILGMPLRRAFAVIQEMFEFAIGQGHPHLVGLLLETSPRLRISLYNNTRKLLHRIKESHDCTKDEYRSRVDRYRAIRDLLRDHTYHYVNRALPTAHEAIKLSVKDGHKRVKVTLFADILEKIISFL